MSAAKEAVRLLTLLARATDIIQQDRDALIDGCTMPFGDLTTLDEAARTYVDRYDAWLAEARRALGVQP